MTNLTYAALLALSDSEQLMDERLAIMVHDGGLSEEEARAMVERRQGELFGEEDNDKDHRHAERRPCAATGYRTGGGISDLF